MKVIEIKNNDWEESIKYYYSNKTTCAKLDFIKEVGKMEDFRIDCPDIVELDENLLKEHDFIEFLKLLNESSIEIETTCIIDEWDLKIHYIETPRHFAIRVWETSA